MTLELVYENQWIVREIANASDKLNCVISNTEKFEKAVFKRIANYLEKDISNTRNRKYIRRMIYQEVSAYCNRSYRKELAVKFSDIGRMYDFDEEVLEYDPPDTLASVESGLEIKETIDLLAKDDRKKRFVLSEWANGNFNDSEISGMLAHTFGGNAASHRIFIQRFRTFCQRELATAI